MPRLWLLLCILLIPLSTIQAQDKLAAPIEITYKGLGIRQKATEQWIDLRDGSVAVIGEGDAVQTNDDGRGIINFLDYGTIMLLPNSQFELDSFRIESGQLYLEAQMLGTFILEFTDSENLHLKTPDLEIVGITGDAGLWASETQADVLVVDQGFVTIQFDGRTGTIGEAEGWRYNAADFELTRLDEPYNRARLIGTLDGCTGIVHTSEGNRGVIVRTGPGQGFQKRGLIEDNQTASLLAKTETTGWTRIQHANAFGWILSSAVESNCELPVLPDDSPEEETLHVINGDERELALLRPFFGIVGLDGFFYQFDENR